MILHYEPILIQLRVKTKDSIWMALHKLINPELKFDVQIELPFVLARSIWEGIGNFVLNTIWRDWRDH